MRSDEETQANMSKDQIELINKNIVQLNDSYKKRINELMKVEGVLNNENKVLKEYAEGKISKDDLDKLIEQRLAF